MLRGCPLQRNSPGLALRWLVHGCFCHYFSHCHCFNLLAAPAFPPLRLITDRCSPVPAGDSENSVRLQARSLYSYNMFSLEKSSHKGKLLAKEMFDFELLDMKASPQIRGLTYLLSANN